MEDFGFTDFSDTSQFDVDSQFMDFSDSQCIDFSDVPQNQSFTTNTTKDTKYDSDYSHATIEYYRAARLRKMDPITMDDVDTSTAFEFKWMWDPYTGERSSKQDPYGSLWFNPNSLIRHFYVNRLAELWNESVQHLDGLYAGYYGDGLGSGEDIFIQGRGHHPERYLFRIPIINCYLSKDHKESFITMGPKLTQEEIALIESLAEKTGDQYRNLYGHPRPSAVNLKYFYDQALSQNPIMNKQDETMFRENNITDPVQRKDQLNRRAVDTLKAMVG